MLLGFVAPLGVNISVLRHIPDYLVRGKLRRLAGHIQWAPHSSCSGTLFSAALAGLLYLSRDFVAPHPRATDSHCYLLAILCALGSL